MKGFVYIFSNPAYPGQVKIGKAQSPKSRVKQLSGETGVLKPFRIEAYFRSQDYTTDEQLAHLTLAEYRTRPNKEFFAITPEAATFELMKLFGEPKYCRKLVQEQAQQRAQQAAQEQQQRQQRQQELLHQRALQTTALKTKRRQELRRLKWGAFGIGIVVLGVLICTIRFIVFTQ